MRRKIRCDCKLRGLPVQQRVKVDAWLFEEGFTYEEVVEGCFSEFGLKVSKSSVGRYYERVSADRFRKVQREKRMAMEPELSPADAYEELLRRIAVLAWEEMDQPLEDINHKVVVRLVRVLIAARREKHMETRVWVERRKAENWMAREVLRHWRRTMKKTAQVSYLPMFAERNEAPLPGPLPHCVAERERSARIGKTTNGGQRSARPTSGCDMENTPIQTSGVGKRAEKVEKIPGGNTHESTIGLQLGGNSITKSGTKTSLTINHNQAISCHPHFRDQDLLEAGVCSRDVLPRDL